VQVQLIFDFKNSARPKFFCVFFSLLIICSFCFFQGRNIQTGENAAIKVIKIESGDDFQQIEQEIMMLKNCNHKNIIR
jgi:hypothetical protein